MRIASQAEAVSADVVSDNRLLADAIGRVLADTGLVSCIDYIRIGKFTQFLDMTRSPDLLILDIDCFETESELIEFTRRATHALPHTRLVALGRQSQTKWLARCVELGVNGCILESAGVSEMTSTIEAVIGGNARCCGSVAAAVLKRIRHLAEAKRQTAECCGIELTAREREIVALLEQGLLNKEISRKLGLALSTVKNHLHRVYEKLEVDSRRGAVRQAIAAGLLHCQAPPSGL